jgi:hypothetical protein
MEPGAGVPRIPWKAVDSSFPKEEGATHTLRKQQACGPLSCPPLSALLLPLKLLSPLL